MNNGQSLDELASDLVNTIGTLTKENDYFKMIMGRQNKIKEAILSIFLGLASYPKMVLEVFLRRDMGERYINLGSLLTVTILLVLIPAYHLEFSSSFLFSLALHEDPLWYAFTAVFFAFGIRRWVETLRNPAIINLDRFSACTGRIYPIFFSIKLPLVYTTPRIIECLLEPLPFFIAGLLLMPFSNLGMLLTICSVFYSMSYIAAYYMGDQYLMNKIDEKIVNEGIARVFDLNEAPYMDNGFLFRGRIPTDPLTRQKIGETIFGNNPNDAVKVK